VIISHVFLPPLPPFSQSLTRWTAFWILLFYRQSHDRAQRIIVWFPFISIAHLPNLCSESQPRWSYNDKSGGSPLVRTESAHTPREHVGGIWFQYGLLENDTAGYGCECIFFGWASFLALCPGGSQVRDGIKYYQKTSLKNMVWYCISYLHLFFQPFACLLTWNTGPRLMVDSDVKSFICFVARRNSMRLMIGCFIPFQVPYMSALTSTPHMLKEWKFQFPQSHLFFSFLNTETDNCSPHRHNYLLVWPKYHLRMNRFILPCNDLRYCARAGVTTCR